VSDNVLSDMIIEYIDIAIVIGVLSISLYSGFQIVVTGLLFTAENR